ncbi:O-antigen ligase family protein [Sphingomonas sp. IC-11]|uniref:O-antigen ligase family protein n=1 Tax=Sphingomonas sp. IC-11 TaxID=2898528 RepID=UPI001E3F25CD|nr:O-antigen ligase family protein [Sphingomonas sp. IC-11]MCD2314910.1 O-antigen ligase family protein [Sphingomonas sp. IC-11]
MSDAVRPPDHAAPMLARRRRKPLNARTAEGHGGTEWLASAGFAALLALTILGPSMTSENYGLQSQIRMAGYLLISLMSLVALEPWRRPERLLVVPWPLLVGLGWCWLSLAWAIEPAVGLRRLVLTSLVLWSTFALVRRLDLERSVLLVRGIFVITLVANFVVALTSPAVGIHPVNPGGFESDLSGDWRGIMIQKNYAGLTCAMTILLFAFHAERVHVALRVAVIIASAVFLYLSDSQTSQIMVVVSLIIGALFTWLAQTKGRERLAPAGLAWVLLAIPAILFVSMAINNAPYLEMLADPAGFTGRTQIWTALIRFYADYPLFGAGYGSFWDLGPTGPIFQYGKGWVTEISQGHNGYLDLLVQIGLPGTLLVLFATLVWPTQRLLRGGDHPVRPLAAAAFIFCLGHNLTESMLFDRDSLSQVFLLIALAWLWMATASDVAGMRAPRVTMPLAGRR